MEEELRQKCMDKYKSSVILLSYHSKQDSLRALTAFFIPLMPRRVALRTQFLFPRR